MILTWNFHKLVLLVLVLVQFAEGGTSWRHLRCGKWKNLSASALVHTWKLKISLSVRKIPKKCFKCGAVPSCSSYLQQQATFPCNNCHTIQQSNCLLLKIVLAWTPAVFCNTWLKFLLNYRVCNLLRCFVAF